MVKKQSLHKVIIWVTVLLCLWLSMGKGWAFFYSFPLAVIGLPIYAVTQFRALKQAKGPLLIWIKLMALLLTISVLLFFICMIGFDDTTNVLVFSSLKSDSNSSLAHISGSIFTFSTISTPISFIVLITLMLINNSKLNSKAKQSAI